MTDIARLREVLARSGFKLQFLADQLGLTRAGFYLKCEGKTEFKQTEIRDLTELLGLSQEERDRIFFAPEVGNAPPSAEGGRE